MRKNKLFLLSVISLFMLIIAACSGADSPDTDNENGAQGDADSNDESSGLPENYPDDKITYFVGYGPGGGTDITARETIRILNENNIIEQTFEVVNMPGSSSGRPYMELLKEPDNPYQIMGVSDTGLPIQNGTIDAVIEDFTPIAQVANDTTVIMVHKDSPYNSLADLVDALLDDPSNITISATGALDTEEPYSWYKILEESTDDEIDVEELNIVPMDSGSEVVTAVLGGHMDAALVNPGNAIEHYEAGNVKLLAVLSAERIPALSEIPTLREEGIDFVFNRPRTVWMGGEVSEDVVKYWEEKLKELTETEDWKEFAEERLIQIDYLNSNELMDLLQEEGPPFEKYIKMVHDKTGN